MSEAQQVAPETAAPAPSEQAAPDVTASPSPSTATNISDWRDSLPEGIRDHQAIQDTASVEALAQRFLDTKQMVGNSLRIPTNEAGSEDINAFNEKILANERLGLMRRPDPTDPDAMAQVYAALGRPEDPSGYQVVEGADPNTFGALAAKAHELGITKAQYEGLAAAQVEMVGGQTQEMTQEQQAGLQQLKGEWATAYDDKVGRIAQLVDATKAPESLKNAIGEGNVGADVLRWLDSVATQLGTEGSPMANQLNNVTSETRYDLEQKRDEIGMRLMDNDIGPKQREELIQKRLEYIEKLGKFR